MFFSSFVFLTGVAGAHNGTHNTTNAHTTTVTGGADPLAVAAIVAGLLIVLGMAVYAVWDYRRRTNT